MFKLESFNLQLLAHCLLVTIPHQITHPEIAAKIDDFIYKLKECMEVKSPFTVVRLLIVTYYINAILSDS